MYNELQPEFSTDRRTVLRAAAVLGATSGGLLQFGAMPARATTTIGGPVVLMGIDAEDFGVGGHGPISAYVSVMNSILSQVTNGGNGVLVIGGENDGGTGDVTTFWNEIGVQTGEAITYVRGASNIQAQSFSGYAMLTVVSSYPETADGMSQAENDALVGRSADVATFVNNGGGLFGSSQTNFTNAWAYVDSLGGFSTMTSLFYDDVVPTPEGNAIGFTDTNMDVTAWHDTFTTWPAFLDVLAWRAGYVGQQAAALGGAQVIISTCSQTYDLCAGQDMPAGTVTIVETSDGYDVTYDTSDGWQLVETHLDVGDELSDFHTNKKGNPKIGNFDYSASHSGETSYTYELSMADPQLTDVEDDVDCVLFAPHAVVEKVVAEAPFYASSVVDYDQGTQKDGDPVRAARSDPTNALEYEAGQDESNFFSLGFGGSIVVRFDDPVVNGPGDDIRVIEDTWGGNYPLESADVSVSQDGSTWHFLGTADNTNLANIHTTSSFDLDTVGLDWVQYVEVVDTSNPDDFTGSGSSGPDADGYDLNAVEALHDYTVDETAWPCEDEDSDEGADETVFQFVDEKGGSWATYVKLCCE